MTSSTSNWTCSVCTYENQPTSGMCEMCGNMLLDENAVQWECALCTVVNKDTQDSCTVCGAPSPLKHNLSGKTICPHCTVINADTAESCDVCGGVLIIKPSNASTSNASKSKSEPEPMFIDIDGGNNDNIENMESTDNNENNENNNEEQYEIVQSIQPSKKNTKIVKPQQQPPSQLSSHTSSTSTFNNFMSLFSSPAKSQSKPRKSKSKKKSKRYSSTTKKSSRRHDRKRKKRRSRKHKHSKHRRHADDSDSLSDGEIVIESDDTESDNDSESRSRSGSESSSDDHSSSHHNHNHKNNNNAEVQFKDISELMDETKEKKRLKREQKEIVPLSEWYEHVYLTAKADYDPQHISDIIDQMIKFIPDEHIKKLKKVYAKAVKQRQRARSNSNARMDTDVSDVNDNGSENANENENGNGNENENENEQKKEDPCQVCYMPFDANESPRIQMDMYCDHAMICALCFKQHLKIKVKDDDITPWVMCAAEDCKALVSPQQLIEHLSLSSLYKFCCSFLRKHLARNRNWVPCPTKKCDYGWVILGKDMSKKYKKKCDSCRKKHTVCKDPLAADDGYQALIRDGTLRLCPKCALPTMKDKGMCNIISCGKCGIFWNWKTNETGTSSSQLKNKARSNGTLWEAGELRYQMDLQKTNLPEFVKLLQRNGIKYDPNYRRGQ